VDGLVVDGAQHGTGLGALVTMLEAHSDQGLKDDMAVLAQDKVGWDLQGMRSDAGYLCATLTTSIGSTQTAFPVAAAVPFHS
jgi:hypothetical protein